PKPQAFSYRMAASQRVAGSVTSRAQTWRGVRYSYGAMSRRATDCSGFTSQVFKSVGVKLPRTSREQSGVGSKVGKGSLSAGDLVFFHTTRGKRISHVGIYMGGGKFIHASSGGGKVMVSNLNEGYYRNRFVTARRISGAKIQGQAAVKAAQAKHSEKLPDILPDSVEDTEITR
ncbi:NlpC/P60 family protein, partial [bacterium]